MFREFNRARTGSGTSVVGRQNFMLNVFLVIFLAVVFLVLFIFLRKRKRKHMPPLVRSEYWIYTSAGNLPSDKELMERLLARNPHRIGGVPIGAKAGLTFSDIRFHIGFARREHNAMMFRPEILCETDAEIPSDTPSVLEETNAAIRVTFVSENKPIEDTSYLQFVTHCVDALAELANAPLIYDVEAQKFWKREDLYDELQRNSRGDRFDLHVVIHWVETTDAGWAFTRGMAKVGVPDVEFGPVPLDHKTIALYLVEAAAKECWEKRNSETMTVEGFGESFRIEFGEAIPNSKTHRSWVAPMRVVRQIKMA